MADLTDPSCQGISPRRTQSHQGTPWRIRDSTPFATSRLGPSPPPHHSSEEQRYWRPRPPGGGGTQCVDVGNKKEIGLSPCPAPRTPNALLAVLRLAWHAENRSGQILCR